MKLLSRWSRKSFKLKKMLRMLEIKCNIRLERKCRMLKWVKVKDKVANNSSNRDKANSSSNNRDKSKPSFEIQA
jgi:hypothetical protein